MSNLTTFYGWFYTQALRLCPRGFRADFGHEMRAVFVQAIEPHAGTGRALSFLLRELEDLPFAEIAENLGCGEPTARVHHHRACGKLRQLLDEGNDLVFDADAGGMLS